MFRKIHTLLTAAVFFGLSIASAGNGGNSAHTDQPGDPVRALNEDLTVRIPGDYPTLQQAIDELSGSLLPAQGTKIILKIEAGHRPSSGLVVEGGDFGHFWIRSEDEEVIVAEDFEGEFLRGTYARLPVLDALIDMDGRGGDGVHARESSSARIAEGAGIRNAGENGVFGWVSSIYMERSIVTGSGVDNLRISTSHVHARFSDLSGATRNNVRASYGSSVRSTFCDLSDAGSRGVYAVRSRIIAEASDITNAGQYAVFSNRGSTVHLTYNHGPTDLSNAGIRGIFATNASTVEGQEVIIHNAGQEGVRAQQHSNVSIREADIRGCDRAIVSTGGSRVEILNGTAKDSTGDYDLVAENGGILIATGTETTRGSPALADTNVEAFNVHTATGIIYD